MVRNIVIVCFFVVISVCCANLEYPNARRDDSIVEDLHGTLVADPYRWLEDPDSEETKQFVEAENKFSENFLSSSDKWNKFNEKLTQLWNYTKYSLPRRKGNYYFSSKNNGLQNQDVLYKQATLEDEPSVFLDPNAFSPDGTVSLEGTSFSDDGHLLAYALSESGSDWRILKVRDVETGKDYSDHLVRVKFSGISWTHDNNGFFYSRYPDEDKAPDGTDNNAYANQKLYYHRIGDDQTKDVLIAEFPANPSWRISGIVSSCGKYLISYISKEYDNKSVLYADLEKNGEITGKIALKPIIQDTKDNFGYITNIGSKIVVQTNNNAPNYRVIVIDLNNSGEENWSTLIPEHEKDVLDQVFCVDNDKILTISFHDVKSAIEVRSLETGQFIRKFTLEIGQIGAFSGSKKYSEIFYQFVSFTTPGTVYRYDFTKPDEQPTIFREVELNWEGFDKNNYITKQVFYPSLDGTKIPMFTVEKKTGKKGPKPALLHGYGGFSISRLPSFSPVWFYFIEEFDGIFALANIRGGGEYGKKWHDAGRLLNKQNVFDDFQAAAKYLVEQKLTEHKMLAIQGGSNGGLLVGACITQRPDLFGAAVPQVGVLDMLRFHKFTIGRAWIGDYGDPDDKVHFKNLYKYSPLHNVHSPNSTRYQYPPTLILTGDHDDRVSPLHSLKFGAELQYAVRNNEFQKNPILLRVYTDTGHGAGKPTTKKIDEATDILTFLHQALRVDADF